MDKKRGLDMDKRGSRLETNMIKVSVRNGQFSSTIPKGVAEICELKKGSVLKFVAYPGKIIRVEVLE